MKMITLLLLLSIPYFGNSQISYESISKKNESTNRPLYINEAIQKFNLIIKDTINKIDTNLKIKWNHQGGYIFNLLNSLNLMSESKYFSVYKNIYLVNIENWSHGFKYQICFMEVHFSNATLASLAYNSFYKPRKKYRMGSTIAQKIRLIKNGESVLVLQTIAFGDITINGFIDSFNLSFKK